MDPTHAARPLAALLGAAGIDAALPPTSAGITITAIDSDSRSVGPGSLFVALSGRQADGHQFIAEAVARGAVAVVAERIPAAPLDDSIPVVIVANARLAVSTTTRAGASA